MECFNLVLIVLTAMVILSQTDAATNSTLRERKAQLVKKLLRKHKLLEGKIRLVGGRVPSEGNVEVHHMDKWGSVCDDQWDTNDAKVVCRQLGYDRALKATHSSTFGRARRRFWMDNLYCSGEEKDLSECRFDGWGSHDCTDAEGAGVICEDPDRDESDREDPEIATPPPPRPMKHLIKDMVGSTVAIRLAGGRFPQEGRVQIKTNYGGWGLICGDGWSLLEANVVCRELGLGYASAAVQSDFFGGNRSDVLFSGVTCRGNENSLVDCHHEKIICPGRMENIAGVVCNKEMADMVLDYGELSRSAHLEDRQLFFLQCAMEENCLASRAYEIQKEGSANWHLETRRLLRFTAKIDNMGTAHFRPFIPKHLWEWHHCHMHYHSMEVFATFDVLDASGKRVAEGHKASFCLEDNQCNDGLEPFYACANFGDQGISVNCSDIYRYNIDCQWVDISELDPGMYTLKVSVNPEFKVGEMTFENNAARCNLLYTETFARVYNCTHERP